jgi:hypothetical protein
MKMTLKTERNAMQNMKMKIEDDVRRPMDIMTMRMKT